MASVSVIEAGRPVLGAPVSALRTWRGGLQGSEFAWALAFCIPYVGGIPRLCRLSDRLWAVARPQAAPLCGVVHDPIFQMTVVNTHASIW